jgi:hypothetical protein
LIWHCCMQRRAELASAFLDPMSSNVHRSEHKDEVDEASAALLIKSDNNQSGSTSDDIKITVSQEGSATGGGKWFSKRTLMFLFCFFGLQASYLTWVSHIHLFHKL